MSATVFGKTSGLFKRDSTGAVLNELTDLATDEFLTNGTITMKTDGTCGMLFTHDNKYYLCRRQDIRQNSRNFDSVMKLGQTVTIADKPCFKSVMTRGSGKTERKVDVYIFMLDSDGKPELEGNHMIGFTPILEDFGEDRHIMSAISGTNCTDNLSIYTTCSDYTIANNKICIKVQQMPAQDILGSQSMKTVEIMGRKVSDKYNYQSDKHFVNPHGSIIIPPEFAPTVSQLKSVEDLTMWFNDKTNAFADSEGFVIHYQNQRIKCHRGYVGSEQYWTKTKSCGTEFHFV